MYFNCRSRWQKTLNLITMKKILAVIAFAAISMTVSAQVVKDLVTYDGPQFSVQHPKDYKDVVDPWDDAVNVWKKDDNHKLSVWYGDDVTPVDMLKLYGETVKMSKENPDDGTPGWKIDDPIIKDNIMILRKVREEFVEYDYVVVIQETEAFTGVFSCMLNEEEEYLPILNKILHTMKKK